MSIYLIDRFHLEVISKGSESTLPENLPDDWLEILSQIDFGVDDQGEPYGLCLEVNPEAQDGLFTYAVLHVLIAKYGCSSSEEMQFTTEELYNFFSYYKIELAIEMVIRRTGQLLTRPTLETIFKDRAF